MSTAKEPPPDLAERFFAFALRIVRLVGSLYESPGLGRSFAYPLSKSGPEIGALYEEAQAAGERTEFIHKNTIALQQARRTHYWLRLLLASELVAPALLTGLVDECGQLAKILGSIVYRAKHNLD